MALTADLYIVAAGNGSRLKTSVPKPLVPITENEPCLTTTLQQIGGKFRQVFVVTNVLARDHWHSYYHGLQTRHPELAKSVVDLQITSGLGDGHATLHGLLAAERRGDPNLAQDIVIAWGDVFWPHAELIDELYSVALPSSGLLPAVHESNPYVALLVDDRMQCLSADFSKHGEKHTSGLHDQSVFRFTRPALKASLVALHESLWKGGRYITPGGELSLLYSFHHLYNQGNPVYIYQTDYPTLSFNTVEEVRAIQRQVRGQWRGRAHPEQAAGKQPLNCDI
jgi:NDP-sugar pyrophosphorylase family protein